MEVVTDFSTLGMHMVDNYLVVQVNVELDDDYAITLRKGILDRIKTTGTKGVIIDVSAVTFLDGFTFAILADTARMVSMLGADSVFVGFQPGVASALIDLDIDIGNIRTAVTMDDGFDMIRRQITPPEASEESEAEMAENETDEIRETSDADGE